MLLKLAKLFSEFKIFRVKNLKSAVEKAKEVAKKEDLSSFLPCLC